MEAPAGPGCMRGQEENEMGPVVVSDTHQKKASAILIKAKAKGQNPGRWSQTARAGLRRGYWCRRHPV
ncbi:hypothetical protein MJ561_03630 [Klebsiella pneumoniae]|nr:hypothetical protein MJ561_03630 [Klebsiella pneumoniae]